MQTKKILNLGDDKENYSAKNNFNYLKIKTMDNGQLLDKNKNKLTIINPITRNNSLSYPLTNRANNPQKEKIIQKNLKIFPNKKNLPKLNYLSYDNLPLLNIKKKPKNYNSESENENNNNFDSLNESNGEESNYDRHLEELSLEIKEKYKYLIMLLGEDIIKKLFSNNIYNQQEVLEFLIEKIKDIIIFKSDNLEEANNYIISLINIIIMFLEDKHPIIIMKCLELFITILKAIEEKSKLNKVDYNFKISRPIIVKIKEKLNHFSKRISLKASELYCYMLESKICDFYSLVSELIEEETNEYYYKIDILNNGNYNLKMNNSNEININPNNLKFDFNKNLIVKKMNIFLKIFTNYEFNIKRFNIKKFPKKLVGDYIIMNISNNKEEVRDISKNVLLKYINIFGNDIFYKLKLVIGNKELIIVS